MNPNELTQSIERMHSARPALRPALHASAVALGMALADERDDLLAKLETRWRWLDDHLNHPQFSDREEAVLEDLKIYMEQQDALNAAAVSLFGDAA